MNDLLGMPQLASAHGGELDFVNLLVHVLMAILFVGWGALFLYMLVRFRRSKNPKAQYAGLKTRATTVAEWAVIASEALLLFGFSIPLWSQRVDDFPPEDQATRVRLVAEQFAWTAHYAGNDGIFGAARPDLVDVSTNPLGLDPNDPNGSDDVVSVNQLHLPVDRPAIVDLSSKDVIHSFMLNEMRVKQDAIPGMVVPVWFTPTVTTAEMRERVGDDEFNYEIACAQLCGIGHYRMRGFVTIHEGDAFDRWLATESESAAATESDDFWN